MSVRVDILNMVISGTQSNCEHNSLTHLLFGGVYYKASSTQLGFLCNSWLDKTKKPQSEITDYTMVVINSVF